MKDALEKIDEKTARKILDFLARRMGYEKVDVWACGSNKIHPVRLVKKHSGNVDIVAHIYAYVSGHMEYVSIHGNSMSSLRILQVLLDICSRNDIFLGSTCRTFMQKGCRLENILIELELEEMA